MDATVRAEARAQADGAKKRMLAEKEKARPDSPEFRAALAEERQGASLYEQLAYKDAAERFRTAETLFTRGAAPVAPTPSPTAPAPPPAPTPPRLPTPSPF